MLSHNIFPFSVRLTLFIHISRTFYINFALFIRNLFNCFRIIKFFESIDLCKYYIPSEKYYIFCETFNKI